MSEKKTRKRKYEWWKDGLRFCSKCHEYKDPALFSQTQQTQDGLHTWCKSCSAGHVAQWRQDNPELVRAGNAASEKRESVKEYRREYGETFRPRWREKNADKWRSYTAAWRERYPDRNKAQWQKRRAAEAQAEGSFSAQEWRALCEYHGNKCLACGRPGSHETLTADHVVPLSKGGSNYIANIQPLCGPCNFRKATKTIDYREVNT